MGGWRKERLAQNEKELEEKRGQGKGRTLWFSESFVVWKDNTKIAHVHNKFIKERVYKRA